MVHFSPPKIISNQDVFYCDGRALESHVRLDSGSDKEENEVKEVPPAPPPGGWFSVQAWRNWTLRKALDALVGEPLVADYLKEHLPGPVQNLAKVVTQVSEKVLQEDKHWKTIMNYSSNGARNREIWADVQFDERLKATVESTTLVLFGNGLDHLIQLEKADPDGEFLVDLAYGGIKEVVRHLEGFLRAQAIYGDEGKLTEWYGEFRSDLHPCLANEREGELEYYRLASEQLLEVLLPEEGKELAHLAQIAQPQTYRLICKLAPDLMQTMKERALSQHAINSLTIKVVELLHESMNGAGSVEEKLDEEEVVSRPYSKQKKLNSKLGYLVRQVMEMLYPCAGSSLFNVLPLESCLGGLLGPLVTEALQKRTLIETIGEAVDGSLAALCEGEYTWDEKGERTFVPLEVEEGKGELRLTDSASVEKKKQVACEAEKVLALFLRDFLPALCVKKVRSLSCRFDRFVNGFFIGRVVVWSYRLLWRVLSSTLLFLSRLLGIQWAAKHLGMRLTRPVARRVLHQLYHRAHENMYFKIQDVLLEALGEELSSSPTSAS